MALGLAVRDRTPLRLDVEAVALRGIGTRAAVVFTGLGRWWAILGVATTVDVAIGARGGNVRPVAVLFASEVLAQGTVGACKHFFRRVRPEGWLLYREPDLSYPSGHAATAFVFYAQLGRAIAREPRLPRPLALAGVAGSAVCVVGIPWSRLALGAHYATDVLGGLLFGAAWSCAAVALGVER